MFPCRYHLEQTSNSFLPLFRILPSFDCLNISLGSKPPSSIEYRFRSFSRLVWNFPFCSSSIPVTGQEMFFLKNVACACRQYAKGDLTILCREINTSCFPNNASGRSPEGPLLLIGRQFCTSGPIYSAVMNIPRSIVRWLHQRQTSFCGLQSALLRQWMVGTDISSLPPKKALFMTFAGSARLFASTSFTCFARIKRGSSNIVANYFLCRRNGGGPRNDPFRTPNDARSPPKRSSPPYRQDFIRQEIRTLI